MVRGDGILRRIEHDDTRSDLPVDATLVIDPGDLPVEQFVAVVVDRRLRLSDERVVGCRPSARIPASVSLEPLPVLNELLLPGDLVPDVDAVCGDPITDRNAVEVADDERCGSDQLLALGLVERVPHLSDSSRVAEARNRRGRQSRQIASPCGCGRDEAAGSDGTGMGDGCDEVDRTQIAGRAIVDALPIGVELVVKTRSILVLVDRGLPADEIRRVREIQRPRQNTIPRDSPPRDELRGLIHRFPPTPLQLIIGSRCTAQSALGLLLQALQRRRIVAEHTRHLGASRRGFAEPLMQQHRPGSERRGGR